MRLKHEKCILENQTGRRQDIVHLEISLHNMILYFGSVWLNLNKYPSVNLKILTNS